MTKIALVDDEQSILTSVSLSLQSEGFTVDTFLNGVEALEALLKANLMIWDCLILRCLKWMEMNFLQKYVRARLKI